MKTGIFTLSLYLLAVVFLGPNVSRASLLCSRTHSGDLPVSLSNLKQKVSEVLAENLKKMPELRAEVETLFAQEDLPIQIQILLWRSLQGQDVEINPFTREDKEQFRFDPSLIGYATTQKIPVIIERKKTGTFNGRLSDPIQRQAEALAGSAFIRDYVIFAPDTKPQWTRFNSLLTVYHELAHVRFNKLLERHPEILLRGQFPEDLVRVDAEMGKVIIDGNFFDYLQERYAFESEFRLFRYIKKKRILFGANPPNWMDFASASEHPETLRHLARQIRINYKILDDPRIAGLDRRRIYDILLNGF